MNPQTCRYHDAGSCRKGLPGTKCDIVGCVAFYPEEAIPVGKKSIIAVPIQNGATRKDDACPFR